MSNVFVFVSGMNPEAYSEIESTFETSVANDNDTISYRSMLNNDSKKLIDFQSMQLACLDEQFNNNHLKCSVSLQDIFMAEVTNYQWQLINKDKLVSIHLSLERSVFLDTDTDMLQSLETFGAYCYSSEVEIINRILAGSAKTLKYLTLNVRGLQSVSTTALTSLACLQYVDISKLRFSHYDMIQLFSSLENWSMVTCLKLEGIICSDHKASCTGVTLDISHLEKLKVLYLLKVVFSKVLLNTKSLVEIKHNNVDGVSPLPLPMSHSSIRQFFNSICEGKSLKQLCVKGIKCLGHSGHEAMYPQLPFDCNGAMLDLSGVNNLRKLTLDMIPMCGLRWSSDALTICDIGFSSPDTKTYLFLTHKNMQPLYSSVASCRKLTYIRIYHIKCLEHNSFCYDSYLHLSQHSKLETLDLKEISLGDFTVNTEALVTCKIDCSVQPIFISSKSIQNFYSFMRDGNKLTTLYICGLIPQLHNNYSILDLSRFEYLNYLYFKAIPLSDIILNTCVLLKCEIAGILEPIKMSHKAIQQFFRSIADGRKLVKIYFENIICSDHYHGHERCNISLDLSHSESLCEVHLINVSGTPVLTSKNVSYLNDTPHHVVSTTSSLHELETIQLNEINFDDNDLLLSSEMISLQSVNLTNCTITSSSWNKLFQCICKLKNPVHLMVTKVDFGDFVLSLCSEIKNSVWLTLADVTISASGCRELFLSVGKIQGSEVNVRLKKAFIRMSAQKNILITEIDCKSHSITIIPDKPMLFALREIVIFFMCLPQSPIVEFRYLDSLTTSNWRELLHNTFHKLSQSITVKTHYCSGLTWDEWNCIVDEIKVSDAFIIEEELKKEKEIEEELKKKKEDISFTFRTVEST